MKHYMKCAINEAHLALDKDEVPVGAIIVCNGEIISKAHNERETKHDPTAHAEITAIKTAASNRKNWRFEDCDIYVTKEPCPMCAGAIQQARFKRLIFGCTDIKTGYAGSVHNTVNDPNLPHKVEIISGIEAEKCRQLLQDFFKNKRK